MPRYESKPILGTAGKKWLWLWWTFYDFANSAYVLLIIAFAFPLFFKYVLASASKNSDFLWGAALGSSVIAAGLLAPFVGSYADVYGRHPQVFRILVILAICGTLSLTLIQPGEWLLGFVIFAFTNTCFNLSVSFYDSYLRRVSIARDIGLVSGFAWGFGYLGGIACLLVVFPWVQAIGQNSFEAYRTIFGVVAAWYLVFSLPILLAIPELLSEANRPKVSPVTLLADTFRRWRSYTPLFTFILAYYFLSDAIATLTDFASIFARETLGYSTMKIAVLLLFVQVVAVPATIASGRLVSLWGPKKVIMSCTCVWVVVCAWLYSANSDMEIYIITTLMGLVIGSTYSAARTMLALLAPSDRTALAFGLNMFSGRVAETVAPMLFGFVSSTTGNQRLGVLSMMPFLLLGLWLMMRVELTVGAVRVTGDEASSAHLKS